MKIKKIMWLTGLMSIAPIAQADFYFGAVANLGTAKTTAMVSDGGDPATLIEKKYDGSIFSLLGQGGFYFSDNFALEMRYGQGLSKSGGVDLDALFGGYGKFNLPISNQVSLYAMAGYSKAKLGLSGAGNSSEAGTSLGAGFHYAFDRSWAMTGEYISYVRKTNTTVDGFALALQYKF